MNLSITSLIVLALVFALALLFSVREAATWFFKIDDLKKDLKYLNQAMLQMESEIASLQNLVGRAKQSPALANMVPRIEAQAQVSNKSVSQEKNIERKSETKSDRPSSPSEFPIVH